MLYQRFLTRDDVENYVKEDQRAKGFCCSRRRSDKKRLELKCIHGGAPANPDGTSRLNNCPFKVLARYRSTEGCWIINQWKTDHDHTPENSAVCRRLDAEERIRFRSLVNAGVGITGALNVLRTDFGNDRSVARDLYNEAYKIREQILDGKTPLQVLMQQIEEKKYASTIDTEPSGSIRGFFFIHKKSLELVRNWGSVLLMDCTYKTNRYKMPLLNIVGISPTSNTFSAGFVFIKEEKEENYVWALEAFKRLCNVNPEVIVTDKENALIYAVESNLLQ